MKYVIYDKVSGKYLTKTGKHIEQVDNLQDADIYKGKLTSLWWEDSYELIPVELKVVDDQQGAQ
jgi:hypothetical protein